MWNKRKGESTFSPASMEVKNMHIGYSYIMTIMSINRIAGHALSPYVGLDSQNCNRANCSSRDGETLQGKEVCIIEMPSSAYMH